MSAKFYELEWVSSIPIATSGFKKNKKPKRYYGGGNGTYIVGFESAKLYVVLVVGKEKVRQNIYKDVKKVISGNLTASIRDRIETVFKSNVIEWENGSISNLDELLKKI